MYEVTVHDVFLFGNLEKLLIFSLLQKNKSKLIGESEKVDLPVLFTTPLLANVAISCTSSV